MSDSRIVTLAADLRNLPYAYHSEADVERMVAALPTNPAWVVEELHNDADTHEECWNQLKADYIRAAARRVADLIGR